MTDGANSRTGLLAIIAVLVVAIVVIVILWQQDRETADLEVDVDINGAGTFVEPPAVAAHRTPRGLHFEPGETDA